MSIGPGTKLGQYEVQEFIGQGAMGTVYRAYHAQLERTGAVKVMQAITPDLATIGRFRHEAQAIAQMRHPNILNVYDFGEFEGTPYMIVEFVAGGSLAGKMKQVPLDTASTLNYLRGIAAGLDYAHALGVVHRDVKPANVLLEKDDTPVLADFGLAKLLQGSSVQSLTGVTTGTPAYMAPEQVTGHQVGPPADRYSLATMAYEMLTGAIPFEGVGVLELLYAHVHRDPPVPSSRNPELSRRVDSVVMRGLAKDPNARWESCEAFVDALEAALSGAPAPEVERTVAFASQLASPPLAPISAYLAGAAPAAVRSDPNATAVMAMPGAVPKRRSRKRLFAILAGLIVLLLVAGVIAVAAAHKNPTLALSSSTVHPGDTLVITAQHLPANQAGFAELHSIVRTYLFVASSSGDVSVQITVPEDIAIGGHLIYLCWSGTCPQHTTLEVLAPVVLATPTPIATPTPSPTPGPSPSPIPSATAHPVPTPSPARQIFALPNPIQVAHTLTVYGRHFSPGTTLTIYFVNSDHRVIPIRSVVVAADGSFTVYFALPSSQLGPGLAAVRVCFGASVTECLFSTITVK